MAKDRTSNCQRKIDDAILRSNRPFWFHFKNRIPIFNPRRSFSSFQTAEPFLSQLRFWPVNSSPIASLSAVPAVKGPRALICLAHALPMSTASGNLNGRRTGSLSGRLVTGTA